MNPGDVLRAVRRDRRLSQRELAAAAGVAKSTIDRIESGTSGRPSFALIDSILDATGYQLAVYTKLGYPVEIDDERWQPGDRAGRLFPAHLRRRRVGSFWDQANPGDGYWWGWHHRAFSDNDPNEPEFTFDMRRTRHPWSPEGNWAYCEAT